MELVVDANVLIAALIKDSRTRRFLLFSGHSFSVPEFVFDEIKKYIGEIKEKTSLSEEEISGVLDEIMTFSKINIVPLDELQEYQDEALRISPDRNDVHYIALALKLRCAIWSNDKDLKEKQGTITVFNSQEIMQ